MVKVPRVPRWQCLLVVAILGALLSLGAILRLWKHRPAGGPEPSGRVEAVVKGRTNEFFPPGALDRRPDVHERLGRVYGFFLLAMQERPLRPPAGESLYAFRLLFLPSFGHSSVTRLTKDGEVWRAVCKQSDGQGGPNPGQLSDEFTRVLSPAEVERLGRLVDRTGFWEMTSFEDVLGLDGSRAVLEGVRPGEYHVVDRWSPTDTPYAELVEFLLGLRGPER